MRWTMMIVLVVWCATAMAQSDRAYIRQGNKHYRAYNPHTCHGDYDKAEVSYHKALNNNNRNPQALYNYGCAMMAQEQDSTAITYLTRAATIEPNPRRRALAYHNIGWIHQCHQDYAAAIEAYKESLRNNPADDETRYNLALCQKLLKDDSSGGGGGGDSNDDQQDQQNQQQQDQQQQQEQEQQDNSSQNPPPQEQEMSRENAEQLLQDAMRQEQEIQDKMQQQQQQPSRRLLKNW